MDKSITFYAFSISHYGEKVRWAMDYSGISYNAVDHWVPMFHWLRSFWLARSRTVPFIKTEQGIVRDSTNILNWLADNRPFPLMPETAEMRAEAMAIEDLADSVGWDIIRHMYIALLERPDDFFEVWGWKAKPLERRALRFMLPVFSRLLSFIVGCGKQDEAKSLERLKHVFSVLDDKLSDGREFLVGGQLSIADISIASILAPILTPPEHSLYSSEFFASSLAEKNKAFEQYASYHWMRGIYRKYRKENIKFVT